MIVFRLEHGKYKDDRTGIGAGPYQHSPYRDTELDFWGEFGREQSLLDEDSRDDYHPAPWRDLKLNGDIRDEEVCGCDSLASLIQWFGAERINRWCERFGFVVARYDVPDEHCRIGSFGQTLFVSRHASLVLEETE